MKELVIEDLLYFNRNIFFGFNILSKILIIDLIKTK